MAQVLAVISGKGGTGKTSLCAGVASCLAMEGQRVLCVDLDVGLRNLAIALGMADMAVLPFTSVMRGEYSLQQASQHPTIGNLSMLTAPVTESAEAVDTEAFERLITQARDGFDWILLDAPAGVGQLFRMAVRCADEAMLVTLPGPASQRDAAHTAELLLQERQIPACGQQDGPEAVCLYALDGRRCDGRRGTAAARRGTGRCICHAGCGRGKAARTIYLPRRGAGLPAYRKAAVRTARSVDENYPIMRT